MSYLYKRMGAAPSDQSIKASLMKLKLAGILYVTNDVDPTVVLAQTKYKETADAAARYREYMRDMKPRKTPHPAKPKQEQDQTNNHWAMTDRIIAALAEQGSQQCNTD